MLTETLQKLYDRDLSKLKEEIGLYRDETVLWKTEGEITNSAGNLTLHLIGNLRHFFGAVLGETGYVRDREKEFSDGGVSREELLAGIDQAAAVDCGRTFRAAGHRHLPLDLCHESRR
ncbi:MAG: hypothetical protein ABL984_20055, partial [Pyrinomonadaceae bacterium]